MKKKPVDNKQQTVDGVTYHYSSDWIHHLESEEHWRLYWWQANLVKDSIQPSDRVLEIGVGSGFMANYLQSKGIDVTTMDIDADKHPDIVANIVTVDWHDYQFDHILAFEVFEHIPFEKFENIIKALSSSCHKTISLSVPLNERVLLRADIRMPIIGRKWINLTIPKFKIDEEHHFWEVGIGHVSKKQIYDMFAVNNFRLAKTYSMFSRLYLKFEKS